MSVKSKLPEILSPFPASIITINRENIFRCAELARQHGVEMLFYSTLKKRYAGSHAPVDDYLKENENSFLRAVAISMRHEVVEKDVVHRLLSEGIPACIIKGNEIARTIYDDPNCRSSADIDVFIRTSDLIDADKILRCNGFSRQDSLPLKFYIGRSHHVSYHHTKKNCMLELHWDFGYPLYFNLSPDDIWNGVIGSDAEGYSLLPENVVLMLFTHHFRHGFREFKILVDILWSFYRYDKTINWMEFAEKLRQYGMIKTTIIILNQLNSVWNLGDDRMESFDILREALKAMPIRVPKMLLRYFQMDIEKKEENFMDMEIAKLCLDEKSRMIYSFLKVFFPRPQDIRAFYSQAGNWMLPLNYLRFFFWRLTKLNVFTK